MNPVAQGAGPVGQIAYKELGLKELGLKELGGHLDRNSARTSRAGSYPRHAGARGAG